MVLITGIELERSDHMVIESIIRVTYLLYLYVIENHYKHLIN